MVFIDEKEVDSRLENEGCLFDWEEHDKQVRADERAKVIEEILSLSKCTSNIHCMMPKNWCISCWNHIIYYDDVYKLKEQNDETLTDDFDKYVDSQLV